MNTEFTANVPVINLPTLESKVEALNKRAVKLGLTPMILTVAEEIEVRPIKMHIFEGREETGEITRNVSFVDITLVGEVPVLDGWAFAGMIDKSEGLNIVTGEIPVELRDSDARHCDHCHTNRDRNKIIVIRNVESGEYMRVGTSCVADFLPKTNTDLLLSAASFFDTVIELIDECALMDDETYTNRSANVVCTEDFLAHVSYAIGKYGWISKTKADEDMITCTGDDAMSLMSNVKFEMSALNPMYVSFYSNAKKAIKRINELSDDDVSDSNYLSNLKELLKEKYIPLKYKNIAASVYVAIENMDKKKLMKLI